MTAGGASPRLRCALCERPAATCLCDGLPPPLPHRTELLILQHPAEAGHAKNTAILLRLGLQRVRLMRGEAFDPALGGPGAALLYPGGGPEAVAGEVKQLILLDGSWRQSRRLLAANPWLAGLPRVSLAPQPSRYRIRRAHRPGQLCTLEAGLHALAALEGGSANFAPLWVAFDRFVAETDARQRQMPLRQTRS